MKQLLALLLLSSFAVSMIGCGDSSAGAENAPPVNKEKDAATEKDGGAAPTPAQD
ncbi:MAG: hypothetical protein QE269_08980 [Fimbriimonas sp.]|nr:hypothetical protein [Fimbriimonas sp.]